MVNTNMLKHLLKLCKLHNVLNGKDITSIQSTYKYMFLFLLVFLIVFSLVGIALAVVVVFVGAWFQPI
jgi:predicted membrane protein